MTCIKCKAEMSQPRMLAMPGRFKKQPLMVNIEGRQCTNCGHQIIEGRRMSEFMKKLGDAYREKRGLLTSEDIRTRRERLGMSQIEFAQYLNVGVASLKRWELGDVQTKLVDEQIRFKTDPAFVEVALESLYRRLVTLGRYEACDADRSRFRPAVANCEQLAA